VKAIQTPNAIVLLDEFTRSHPDAINILFPVLDEGQRYLRLDEADGSPTIKVAEGVSFIATANIGAEYTATRVLDRAMLDRFTVIEMDLLNETQEVNLLKMIYPELSMDKINTIAAIADATRKEVVSESPRLSTIISTRATIEIAGLMMDGFNLLECADIAILPLYSNDGGIDSERAMIMQIIQKHNVTADKDIFNVGAEKEEAPF
jgi:nitric oxide reductase NorQ protein